MTHHLSADPALTVAVAMAAGIVAQAVGRHLKIPGIVFLLGAGVLLGPDAAGLVRPETLGAGLRTLVGFAVAVILFEGGMNLDLRRLGHEARSIRRLVTYGALVTAAGGAVCARMLLGLGWTSSVLFGTLVIVTGPTVVTPLLRRIRVRRNVAIVLEAEGVLVDAVGAIIAVVALEVAISPSGGALAYAFWNLIARLGFGFVLGLAGGWLIASLLRLGRVVPEGLENVFTLSLALALFQTSNAFLPESGLVTVVIAGITVGNVRTRVLADLREFKEQLTVLLIGMLFVLLAADVRIEEVRALGLAGVWTVLALMFVVRPLNVLVGTWGSGLKPKEKLFLCWIAPRGIVAAAVASLFAQTLTEVGIPVGYELRAMVFLVIGATVLLQGLTGGFVAQMLGLRRPSNSGHAILGANDLGRAVGRLLRESGQDVVFLESNPDAFRAAEQEGFRVLFGTGLSEALLQRADLDTRASCMAVTSNDGVNLSFARRAREEFKVPKVWVALRRGHHSVSARMVLDAGAAVLFGEPKNIDLWMLRLERGTGRVERWRRGPVPPPGDSERLEWQGDLDNLLLPVAVNRNGRVMPVDDTLTFREKDVLSAVVFEERHAWADRWLSDRGWQPVARPAAEGEKSERAVRTTPEPGGVTHSVADRPSKKEKRT